MNQSIGASCIWADCTTFLPLSRNVGGTTYQRKYCDEHRPLASAVHASAAYRPGAHLKRKIDRHGYVQIRDPETGRWKAEHRLVLEQDLGRKLVRGESVHQRNGVRDDNRLENLELWVGSIHYGQRATDLRCPHCGKPYR